MPLYVYKCKNCEHQFEVRQRFSDDPLTDCPTCTGEVYRVISPVGVVFKGSGFYVTDTRNGKSGSLVNGSGQTSSEEKSETKEKKTEDSSTAAVPAANKTDKKASASAASPPAA